MPQENQIIDALERIIGKPMWGSGRAVDMEMFAFGQQVPALDKKGRTYRRGEFALHIQCAWHIIERSGLVLIGSRDVYLPANGNGEGQSDWEPQMSNRRDQLLANFFDGQTYDVEGVQAMSGGILLIGFSSEHSLRLFPDFSRDDQEYWRFLRPGTPDPHLVVAPHGIVAE